jgi:hypothetical protein
MIKSILKRKYRNIKFAISNIIFFFSIIVKDRPYDYIYTYIILKRKLERNRTYFVRAHSGLEPMGYYGIASDIESLNRMITLLNYLIADNYENPMDEEEDYNEFMILFNDNLRKFWI